MKKSKPVIRQLFPSHCRELLECNTHEGQRSIIKSTVAKLVDRIDRGVFHCGLVAVYKDFGGKSVLINGQHQLTACIESGKPIWVSYEEWHREKGDTTQKRAEVFGQYGDEGDRTPSQVSWAIGATCGLHHMPRQCVSLCAAALAMTHGESISPTNQVMTDKVERAMLLTKSKTEVRFIYEMFFETSGEKHTRRSPVVAVAIASFRKSPEMAREFWESVHTGEMLKASNPAYVLRSYLINSTVRGTIRGKHMATPHEMIVKCIHAWNAYVSGKTTKLRYSPGSAIPEIKAALPVMVN